MKSILVIGAGRSSTVLIDYLIDCCNKKGWSFILADLDLELAQSKVAGKESVKAVQLDLSDKEKLSELISSSDIVISMVPAHMHVMVASICLDHDKNLITASYVSDEMMAFDEKVKEKGLIFLNECGLDPGLDHMSAMKVIDEIKSDSNNELTAFETFTGGLLSEDTEKNNPWKYKFTWNPRNVVLAGTGTVKFIQEGKYKFIPYHRLFRRTEIIEVPDHCFFEGYANRDSLKYLDVYGLRNIKTLYRGTLRRPGFCRAWDAFVQLGATDDSYQMEGVEKMTHREFINSFLAYNPTDSVELKLAHYLRIDLDSEVMHKFKWLDMFQDIPVGLQKGTPAQILEHILKKKWTMDEDDNDRIVMVHKFRYRSGDTDHGIDSFMVIEGDDSERTAMAKTVGLPLGIAAEMILEGKITSTGVVRPVKKDIYLPILEQLEKMGVVFKEYKFQPQDN
ncbi:saccharopine dehydrogenase NADP-binding domain-containing protein [Mangrovivirga sp. M17]|uniref:Saccharopine dehydrogenase NADP-binding domain-containing protein n=1 Tax=Mangrovivirga halotolerans TaxID=2993936 RepID=A0ABT3RXD3_9BACT|nr:saccharopine dehydrogenase C-terminal domain-containing protein [Mangrovivirga halotolerans]MCX2745795.1 saccharopine dehydrogenase NADP-binding domain-containing protein [Mangrovivirga halotolerans]